MNKQLTKKTIGIAASAALMASVVFSGSALAEHKSNHNSNKKGPQASAAVSSWCEISDEKKGEMKVHIRVEDKSSGSATATVSSLYSELYTQNGGKGNDWGDPLAMGTPYHVGVGDSFVTFDLCPFIKAGTLGKAINAKTTLILQQPASKLAYTARCGNAPGPDGELGTYDDVLGGGLKTADYKVLGESCPTD
jgi:hypothetical protein